jgi:rubrerythrin
MADEEGFPDIAKTYREIAHVEVGHEQRYLALAANLKGSKVFKRDKVVKWRCRNCGYIHEGTEAPEQCPACLHPQAYYEIKQENY